MLITYHSNRLEILAEQLSSVVGTPRRDSLAAEIIIVQSNGMARWLCMHLARHLGICANVHFPFPAAFIWDIFQRILPDIAETSLFDTPVLTWRLLNLLKELEKNPCFDPLQAYLHEGDDFSHYELACRIANSFDQYLVYRPDWILRWQAAEENHWQAELWRRLAAQDDTHRVRLQQRFFEALNPETAAHADLPERVSLIGISALPPIYLEILSGLSPFMEIHLFLLNPCREYWGDIVAERDIARRGADVDPAEAYLTVGNPLLASLGKQGRDFIDLIQTYPCQVMERFVEPEGERLLNRLQQDILNLQERGGSQECPPAPIQADDRSVQIHACHSPLRELEVLYDQLLAQFEENPDLQPADIIVMTPDIEAYAPTIEAVFATATGDRHIPFSIADRGLRSEQPLIDAFFALLDIPGSRFDANQVLTLLEIAAIQRRFGFSENDLPLVYHWIRDIGIRWGIDAANRAALELPATREHTWRAGLDRLLLGYALPGGNSRLLENILPYDEVEGTEAQVMGRLQAFAEAVFNVNSELAGRQPLAGWSGTLSELLDRFLAPTSSDEAEAQILRVALEKMVQDGERAGFYDSVSLEVVKSSLRRHLETAEISVGNFLTGGVTFCALMPMRSIPFQVVCLIGMNDDSYPRPHRPVAFDLMAQQFRRGDRSRRNDDRYLFLEALLSARRCLYLSYVGNNIRDNSVIPPSVLVSELLDIIERGFFCREGQAIREQIVTRHPLQAFSHRYFTGEGKLFSYSKELVKASEISGHGEVDSRPLISTDLPAPDEHWRALELAQLIRFFANPPRYLLQQRLGIYLEAGETVLETREPFTLDHLSEQNLREQMLTLHRFGLTPAETLPILQGKGLLPHGQVGECLFEREQVIVDRFAGRLHKTLPVDALQPLEIDRVLNGFRVTGWLSGLSSHGLIGYRLAPVRARDYLNLWLQHLLLNWLAPENVTLVSHWLGQDREIVLTPLVDPIPYLQHLLQCYWQGLQHPLHFFPKSAFAYVEAIRNRKTSPETIARRIWEGSDFHRGECEDLYYQLTFRGSDPLDEEFMRLAETVFGPLFEHTETGAP